MRRFLLCILAGQLASALEPLPLSTRNDYVAWSRITTVPSPRPTLAVMLELRADSLGLETCGFQTDALSQPFACASGTTCLNSGSIRGCCTSCSTSTFATNCLDKTAPACTNASANHALEYCCTDVSDLSYCNTYLWSTSTDPGSVFSLFACEASSASKPKTLAAEVSVTSKSSSSNSASSSASSTTSAAASHASKSHAGAIAGGVIGGVAGFALLSGALFYLLRRRRSQETGANGVGAGADLGPYGDAYGGAYGGGPGDAAVLGVGDGTVGHYQVDENGSPWHPPAYTPGSATYSEMQGSHVKEAYQPMTPVMPPVELGTLQRSPTELGSEPRYQLA